MSRLHGIGKPTIQGKDVIKCTRFTEGLHMVVGVKNGVGVTAKHVMASARFAFRSHVR